jgi:hypothetical protein
MHARCTRYAPALILILLAAGCSERAAPAAEKPDGPAAVEGDNPIAAEDGDTAEDGDMEEDGDTKEGEDPVTGQVESKLLKLEQGMWDYTKAHERFPAAATHDKDGRPLLSWRVELLPFLGEKELYGQFHHDEPWDSKHNKPLLEKMPEVFYNPRVGDLDGKTVFLVPTGEQTMFFDDRGTTEAQITDGLDNMVSIVEVDAEHAVPWTKPADLPVDKKNPAAGLARDRVGAIVVGEAGGGALKVLLSDTSTARLWSLFTRAGGVKFEWPAAGGSEVVLAGAPEEGEADVRRAGGQVGPPADVIAEFRSPKKPPGIEERVAEKLQKIAGKLSANNYDWFPPTAIYDRHGKPLLSWRVRILPKLNERALYDQFHLDEPWDSEHNLPLVKKMPEIYLNPKLGRLGGKTVFLLPTGKETMYYSDKGTRRTEIEDGTDRTIALVVADAEHAVTWTKPDDLPIDEANPARGLERWPDHFLMMALADAQIMLLPDNIEPNKLWWFFTRAGGERLTSPPGAASDPGR